MIAEPSQPSGLRPGSGGGRPVRVIFSPDAFVQTSGGISRYAARLHVELRQLGVQSTLISGLHWNRFVSPMSGSIGLRLPGWSQRGPILKGVGAANGWATAAATRLVRGPAILHPTYYTAPLPPRSVPSVVTVYDMIHEIFPDGLPDSERNVTHAKGRWLASASRVIAISHQTRIDVLRYSDVDPDKVVVIYPGVDPRSKIDYRRPSLRPYVLHVGNRGSYKNFGPFLDVFGHMSGATEFDLVVFGGEPLRGLEQETASDLGVRLRRVTGPDTMLAAYYQHAHAFVCPSRYEGFGLPPLEAMTYGCPVACSRGGALSEVLGDAAIMFDPVDQHDMALALHQVCFDDATRRDLPGRGMERARRYSWPAAAHATLELYEKLLTDNCPTGR